MLSRRSLLLAHGLGLGKTVTSIAACEELIDSGEAECILIVCPASLKWQWHRQITAFTDGALVKVIEGAKGERRTQYNAVKRGDVEYVIVNYETVVADWDRIRLQTFDAIVIDEIVAIKNPGTKRSRHIKRLQAPYKFGLSGQPIENRPEELYSIMQWIDPSVLGPFAMFDRTFIVRNGWGGVKHYRNLRTLRTRMTGAMHRKTRHDEDVRDQMPAVVEKSYIIDMDARSKRLYDRIVAELIQVIRAAPKIGSFNLASHYAGVDDGGAMGEIMPRLMALRMLCDHPKLLTYSAQNFDDPESQAGSAYISDLRRSGVLVDLKGSPKMDETLRLMTEFLDADPANKIVLFSFFKPMLRILQEAYKGDSEMYNGDLTPKERDAAVQRFQTDPNCRVFFSSDAGGIGVDIPAGNLLISYDLPWSAGKWEQRNGRILRISSEWPEVTLASMLIRDSIEERMYDMLEEKSAVASAWMDGEGVDAQGTFTLTLGTLADFLEERH
jgi:SNF2 family DNA or RNA helicase